MTVITSAVPANMLSMLVRDTCANRMLMPVASPARPGALPCTQRCARSSSSRSSRDHDPSVATTIRVADFAMSIRSFRSLPKGSESSYSRRYCAASSRSSGRRWKAGSSPCMFLLRRFMTSGNACTWVTSGCSLNHAAKASAVRR